MPQTGHLPLVEGSQAQALGICSAFRETRGYTRELKSRAVKALAGTLRLSLNLLTFESSTPQQLKQAQQAKHP